MNKETTTKGTLKNDELTVHEGDMPDVIFARNDLRHTFYPKEDRYLRSEVANEKTRKCIKWATDKILEIGRAWNWEPERIIDLENIVKQAIEEGAKPVITFVSDPDCDSSVDEIRIVTQETTMNMELTEKARALYNAIRKLEPSEFNTMISNDAAKLCVDIEYMELLPIAKEKGWQTPINSAFPNSSWIVYWRGCVNLEKDPDAGRPIAPHRSGR